MIRIFLVILAVVAVVLGVVLSQPLLYAVAGTLALFTLLWVLTDRRQRFGRSTPLPTSSSTPASSPEDELKSLGIMEIRPRTSTRVAASSDATATATAEVTPDPAAKPMSDGGLQETEAPAPSTPVAAASPTETGTARSAVAAYRMRVLQPYLQALRGALEAHTTGLLRQQGPAPDYHIEALSSESAEARSQGHFTTTTPLLPDTAAGVQLRAVDEPDFPLNGLNYYRDRLPVRQLALTTVARAGDDTYLLVADTLKADGLATERQRQLLSQFAALLGTLLAPMIGGAPTDAAEADTGAASDEEADAPRPRRDIIADEIEAARTAGVTLALGLIHRNDADAVAAEGPEAVAAAEAALVDRITTIVPDSRMERFGELTYGVFFHGPITDFDAWAVQLRDGLALEAAPDAPPVSIGIALLQDRHDSPEAFRADAMDALREAYESGTCTILE